MPMVAGIYNRAVPKKYVGVRRINRETMRNKLRRACFVNAPRLVLNGKVIRVKVI